MKREKDKALAVAHRMLKAAGGPVPKKEAGRRPRFEIAPEEIVEEDVIFPADEIHPDSLFGMNPDLNPYEYPRRLAEGGEVKSYRPTKRDELARKILGDKKPSFAREQFVQGLLGSRGLGTTGVGLIDFVPFLGSLLGVEEAEKTTGSKSDMLMNTLPGAAGTKAMFLGPFGAMMQRRMAREAGKPAYVHPVIGQEVKDKVEHIHPKLRGPLRGWEADRRDALGEYNITARPEDPYKDRLNFSETGWSRGADGLPRKEIDDLGLRLEKAPGTGAMDIRGRVIPNTEMYRIEHPHADLHEIYDLPPVKINPLGGRGSFNPQTRKITLGSARDNASATHEISHPIQHAEGFAPGSNPRQLMSRSETESLRKGLPPEGRNAFDREYFPDGPIPAWHQRHAEQLEEAGEDSASPYWRERVAAQEGYESSMGEAEANNAMRRRSKGYLYKEYPEDTSPIPYGLQWYDRYEKKSHGGATAPMMTNKRGTKFNSGALKSTIPGRTDKIPLKVRAGSYVLPADIPSALGQGNTDAGTSILDKMFKKGPYGMNLPRAKKGSSTQMSRSRTLTSRKVFADGGETPESEIIAAGGEYILDPEQVMDIGNGDIDAGHQVLDSFVEQVRSMNINTLKKLPGPKQG